MRWLFDRNVLENESRAVIFKYIKENPETYAQKIIQETNISKGTAIKSIFAILILIISTPVYASEENTLQIENITSISSIVNPATLDLAKSVKAAPERRNFLTPQAFWSPDGSRLLIESSNEVFIAKLSGYDILNAIKKGYRAANESIQELPEPTLTAVPQITGSITATTPRTPGFGATLAIGILYTIYLFKRRYN